MCGGGAAEGPCKVRHQKLALVLNLTQGDSGGPLTVVNEEDNHVLVGIVSRGDSCDQQDYSVFTSVSAFLPWIESAIKESGGMASCNFNIFAPPTLGMSPTICQIQNIKILEISNNKATHLVQENHWSLPLRLVFWCWAVNQKKDNLLPSRLSALRTVQFLLYQKPDTVSDPSSPPPKRHSWLYVAGGGWGNHTPQIASHSM